MKKLTQVIRALPTLFLLPVYLQEFLRPSTGRQYGLSTAAKLRLAARIVLNTFRMTSGSNFVTHLLMAGRILRVPADVAGCIVECGSFKGASTASLSLVAAACGRELHVFDSFEGLPPPAADDRAHVVLNRGEIHTYEAGSYAGSLDEVKGNVAAHGDLAPCHFHKGFFETTLPDFDRPVVFAYIDVDLVSSEKTCLQHLWPLVADGCSVFTDEAHHLEIAGLFYDRTWWQETLHSDPPGLVGAGNGLGLFPAEGGSRSSVGYTVKAPATLVERPQHD